MMNNGRRVVRDAGNALRRIFSELGTFNFSTQLDERLGDLTCDAVIHVSLAKSAFDLAIEAKARITPQTAISVCEHMRRLPDSVIPVVYAPVISPRVVEVVKQYGLGYLDEAGNAYLRSESHGILVDRRGYKPIHRPPTRSADPFSPKSSRIIRALLTQPTKGWQVRELAEHPGVNVSVGLVSKVKRALVEEGYALEQQRLLYLRDPVALLRNWASHYPGPVEQIPLYIRGDVNAAEHAVARWCDDHDLHGALAGFSAAWRLAPEVRYTVGTMYVESRGLEPAMLETLAAEQGGKRVDTGANLMLWQPFDASVLVDSRRERPEEPPVTSPLQTYLDLKRLTGRGEEAAGAVYEAYLGRQLEEPAGHAKER